MKIKRKRPAQPLAKGQLWQIDDAYIQIVELGRRLIQYKMLRQQGQRAVRTQMTGIENLETYLKDNSARLVSES
ncbi:MAG TPA: hypothetical protein VG167_20790 [Verrucomicrobiae bacterium]|jgi:hypothetical protein|nr:hypothetical protein [Verrucomicrobiae bacterium]